MSVYTNLLKSDLEREVLDLVSHLFDLAREGNSAELGAYLDAGAPVNLTNTKGDTLLMLAAYHGHEATVVELLVRGADPNRANDRGQTPLGAAVFKNTPAIANRLLEANADPHAGSPSAIETAHFFGRSGYDWRV